MSASIKIKSLDLPTGFTKKVLSTSGGGQIFIITTVLRDLYAPLSGRVCCSNGRASKLKGQIITVIRCINIHCKWKEQAIACQERPFLRLSIGLFTVFSIILTTNGRWCCSPSGICDWKGIGQALSCYTSSYSSACWLKWKSQLRHWMIIL